MTPEFLLTTFIVVATPGTGVLYTLAAGLSRGARASVIAAVGCTLGIVPHMLAAITGLAAVLHTSAVAFDVLKYFGVGYLMFLAWRTWRDTASLEIDAQKPARSDRSIIVEAVLINILNPKLTIFFFAFLPLFVPSTTADAPVQMVGLSAVFMLATFVVFVAYGLLASAVRDHVIRRPRVIAGMRRLFAVGYVALGARLALTDR